MRALPSTTAAFTAVVLTGGVWIGLTHTGYQLIAPHTEPGLVGERAGEEES